MIVPQARYSCQNYHTADQGATQMAGGYEVSFITLKLTNITHPFRRFSVTLAPTLQASSALRYGNETETLFF